MLFFKSLFIIFLSNVSLVFLEPMIKNENNYGPYILSVDSYGDCKGPKANNVTIMSTTMDEHFIGTINLTFLDDAKLDEMRIHVDRLKDNKKNFLWNYRLNDPCKHFVFAALIKQQLNTNNCFIKKGFYKCGANFGEVMQSFLSSSFFYGTFAYKTLLLSNKGNIACFNITMTFKKK